MSEVLTASDVAIVVLFAMSTINLFILGQILKAQITQMKQHGVLFDKIMQLIDLEDEGERSSSHE